jgi:NAD(P)-dependent dehydrogenase (short-subunit alcohol dehydrogenase family)
MFLEGRVAVVSGAAQGMGEAVAHRAARKGARVVVADVNDELGHSKDQHFVATPWPARVLITMITLILRRGPPGNTLRRGACNDDDHR